MSSSYSGDRLSTPLARKHDLLLSRNLPGDDYLGMCDALPPQIHNGETGAL